MGACSMQTEGKQENSQKTAWEPAPVQKDLCGTCRHLQAVRYSPGQEQYICLKTWGYRSKADHCDVSTSK